MLFILDFSRYSLILFFCYNKIMKRRLFWIVELLIWFLIFCLISGAITFVRYNYRKNFNVYQIFLPDVDGLIHGSPVRFMGIQVGYVNQVNIVGDDVYVRFVVTEPNVKLPPGAIATVEFAGLGGSKSLELYPPTSHITPTSKLIVAQSPKRIHDSLGLLNEMFDQVVEITYTVSNFIEKIGFIKTNISADKKDPMQSANKFINFSNGWLDKAQKQCDNLNHKLNGKKKVKKDNNDEQRANQNN